jgi:fructose-bisphosphate aldolase class II
MPIATPEIFAEMIDRAKGRKFAYPSVNVTSSQTVVSALRGFAEAESDGILQISWGGAEFISGQTVKDMAAGARALAGFCHEIAKSYPVQIGLHTDHCPPSKLDGFLRPLIAASLDRVRGGGLPLFTSHMWDGSTLPLADNLNVAGELLRDLAPARIVLELEIGVVGGEEDGVEAKHDAKLYSTPEEGLATAEALGLGESGRYLLAATFGNVHGSYEPGNVTLRPAVLEEIQRGVGVRYGLERPFDLVFHGGSGSSLQEVHEAIGCGVVKMNIDTDTQYAFTRAIADHVFTNYAGVLKVDGRAGDKSVYDPRSYGKLAEARMAARVVQACADLRSVGTRLS